MVALDAKSVDHRSYHNSSLRLTEMCVPNVTAISPIVVETLY